MVLGADASDAAAAAGLSLCFYAACVFEGLFIL